MSTAGIAISVSRKSYAAIPPRFGVNGKYADEYGYAGTHGDEILMRVLAAKTNFVENIDGTFVARCPRAAAACVKFLKKLGLEADCECLRNYGVGNHGGYFCTASDKQAESMMRQMRKFL